MGRSGVAVGASSTAHKVRNAKHAAASAPKPAATPPQPPRPRHRRVEAALHASRGKKHGDVEVLDLVSDATSDSDSDSDSGSDVEILDAGPFVDNEVLVLSDDDDDDDFRGRADEFVLSSDEEDDDSDDQVVIVSDNLAQGPPNRSANAAGKAAPPARFRKARDPAADLKWFMPYATAPKNQDVRLVVFWAPLKSAAQSLTFVLLSPPRTAVPLATQTWPVSVSDESSLYPGTARYSAAMGARAGKDSVARLKGRLSASSPTRRRPPRTLGPVHTLDRSQVSCNTLGASFLPRSLPRKCL